MTLLSTIGTVFLVAFPLCFTSQQTQSIPPEQRSMMIVEGDKKNNDCIAFWDIDSARSVLHEQRESKVPWYDFATTWKSAAILSDAVPIKTLSEIKIPDGPVLWFSAEKKEALVDKRFSSDLTVVNVTRLRAGLTKTIGTLSKERALSASSHGMEILQLLVKADIIQTYVHIGSEVCVKKSAVDEKSAGGAFRADVVGEHTYFTNQKNVDKFSFRFEIKPTGEMTVTGID
jgi:hypothetical protein